jgi:hypothetical protein
MSQRTGSVGKAFQKKQLLDDNHDPLAGSIPLECVEETNLRHGVVDAASYHNDGFRVHWYCYPSNTIRRYAPAFLEALDMRAAPAAQGAACWRCL